MKIPEAALQQHMAVLGKTGSGKTFAVKGIVEGWLSDKKHVGIVDPTGAWWGLRASRDGKGAGFPILVLGGDHGDLPLPALGGAAVARLLTEQGVNLVADTLHLTVGERTRWFIDFAGTLYRTNRTPLHLILDEAHNFAPQGKVPDPDTGKMLHAANTLASGGRARGIRLAMITQRPQKLHKDTLTSADTLIAMRVLAPHDRLAVEDWIKGCGDMATGKEVLNSLASLQRGEGWVWYPEGKFLERMKFPMIKTFDSSATPTDGGVIHAPKGMAEIDLTEIKASMADAVREAEANDPKILRGKIRELEKQLAGRDILEKIVEVPVLKDGQLDRTEKIAGRLQAFADKFLTETAELRRLIAPAAAPRHAPRQMVRQPIPARRVPVERPAPSGEASSLATAQRKLLGALAFLEQVGIATPEKTQVSLFAALSTTAGHTLNMYGGLRSAGLIEYPDAGHVRLTDAGRALADPGRVPQTAEEMQGLLLGRVATAQRKLLTVLIDAYPKALEKQEVAEKAGLIRRSGGFVLTQRRWIAMDSGAGHELF